METPAKPSKDLPSIAAKLLPRVIEDEMKQSYLDYAMSVIVGRALPDVCDGLKPVHRRILYAMHKLGMTHNKPFKKCARIVGEVLGKYHPHGDQAVYDALVRMAQDFSLRYPLIDGQGNFGSLDGDRAAAMRYTEARLSKMAEELLVDIEKNTVRFQPNFDGSLKEPIILPARAPNLLINGTSGIAVGMATNIPPHNLGEVCDAVAFLIDNPEATFDEVMGIIKGPDFPTGGIIAGTAGLRAAFKLGRGKVRVHAKTRTEGTKIIVTEIPYMVNKAHLVEQIADLVKQKLVLGISDLRDESDREGMRIMIELKRDANPEIVLNQLFKHSRLQVTTSIIMIALVNNEPKVLNLMDILRLFIEHRQRIVKSRTRFDLDQAEKRDHILQGLLIALARIDEVIATIKASKDVNEARDRLMTKYKLTVEQANAILEMRLQKLAALEQSKIKKEHTELVEKIAELKAILADDNKIFKIIRDEVLELKAKYPSPRKTEILEMEEEELDIEDLIEEEDVVVTITRSGYAKRISLDEYRQQRRGGKGVIAATTKEQDLIEHVFMANTHSYLLLFTDNGKVHWLKVYRIPEASRMARGKNIVNIINLDEGERVTAFVPVKEFNQGHYVVMCTKRGIVKKTSLKAFSKPRRGGIRAVILEDTDELIAVRLTDNAQQIIIASRLGLAVKFHEKDIRASGRNSKGVIGIRLKKGDFVIGMAIAIDERTLLTITGNGYGKRTPIKEYRLISRGGFGVKNIQCSERNGPVAGVKSVTNFDEVMVISKQGNIIRMPCKDIPVIGRNTQGVRLMRLSPDDAIVATAKVVKD
ncbi:MAG: DNA gyrase subunit A [Nanoarchaeota archaeon]|nr:DNA gyrase subunit A [Nanoarchaeota archaeon]